MKIKELFIYLVVFVLCLAGCNHREMQLDSTNTAIVKNEVTPTIQSVNDVALEEVENTDSPVMFSPTPISILDKLRSNDYLSGTYVYSDGMVLYLYDAKTNNIIEINNGIIESYLLSPKNEYLIFSANLWVDDHSFEKYISIIDESGAKYQLYPKISSGECFWLNENNLGFILSETGIPILKYNFETKMEEKIYPYFDQNGYHFTDYDLIRLWNEYQIYKNVPNPTYTKAIYPSYSDDIPIIVLRDFVSEENLFSFPTNNGWGVSPKWANDGTKFAIGIDTNEYSFDKNPFTKYEVFIFDDMGVSLYTTDFSSITDSVHISMLSWASNGQYIAVSLTINTDEYFGDNYLAVIDLANRSYKIYDVLLPDNFIPIWSPDSQYLLLSSIDPKDRSSNNNLIFDWKNEEAIILKDTNIPIGWLKSDTD